MARGGRGTCGLWGKGLSERPLLQITYLARVNCSATDGPVSGLGREADRVANGAKERKVRLRYDNASSCLDALALCEIERLNCCSARR